jgi:hypothetical protein
VFLRICDEFYLLALQFLVSLWVLSGCQYFKAVGGARHTHHSQAVVADLSARVGEAFAKAIAPGVKAWFSNPFDMATTWSSRLFDIVTGRQVPAA